MKTHLVATALLLILMPGATSAQSSEADSLLNKALDHLLRYGYLGDTSIPRRYLQAVLAEDPDNPEARWQLMVLELAGIANLNLSDRVELLDSVGPDFQELVKLAGKSDRAFMHYVIARYAADHHAYERALGEIDQALALEPQSPRYWLAKGRLLTGYGEWNGNDAVIEQGIRLIKKARDLSKGQPNPSALLRDYDFHIAYAIADLSQPRWEEVVDDYLNYIEQSEEASTTYAFAWNNLSIAYRKLGDCVSAREAAENALKVMPFGAAESNLRYAEVCIEMQRLGILGEDGKLDLDAVLQK